MADSAQVEGRNGGGSGKPERPTAMPAQPPYAHARAYEYALAYAQARALVSLAVKGSGLLAFLLSTVILLGGFVSSLGKKDFFCITVITVIEAAGIFKDWERSLQYLLDFMYTIILLMGKAFVLMLNFLVTGNLKGFLISYLSSLVVVLPLSVVALCVELIYLLGPFACAAISSWRIAKLNHGNRDDGTDSMSDMMAALNIFYSLVIFQGTMFGVLFFALSVGDSFVASHILAVEELSEKWGNEAIRRYISDITAKCRKDPLSIRGRDLIKYAAELLDSESQDDYLCGTRLLSAFVNKGEDVSWVLLPSGQKIQRLIDSLVISSSGSSADEPCIQLDRGRCITVMGSLDDKKEIRELAATIVADVAAHIGDLSKYPGAMRCISSLLQHQEETTQQTYQNRNSKQVPDDLLPPHQGPIGPLTKQEHNRQEKRMLNLGGRQWRLMRDQQRLVIREHRHRQNSKGGTSNELVQKGLTILERLASNSDNRRLICSTPGLLPKITEPVYSATLIQDVKTKEWADIVTRCFKVLYQLIRAPDGSHEIFSSDVQALSNLKIILELGNNEADHQELQLVAMKILTELALDLSINLSEEIKKVLVTKLLQLFLLNGDNGEESAATAMAGRTLVSLSTNSEGNSALIMTTQNDIIGRLTGMLDDKKNITRRTIAAEIMANLCAHCNVDNMKEILPNVLREIMSIKGKSQERKFSAGQNNPASGDEENQGISVSTNNEVRHGTPRVLRILRYLGVTQQSLEEISDQEREQQEAFLSLAQVICDKLDSAALDGAIQNAVQNKNNAGSEEQRREAFVDKLKTIIDDNRNPTEESLRIVKLSSRIAESTMRCQQYVEHFRNKGFKSSLSEASETMSELESCMLFVGTDFGVKKTVRPLFSEIEETWSKIEDN